MANDNARMAMVEIARAEVKVSAALCRGKSPERGKTSDAFEKGVPRNEQCGEGLPWGIH